MQIRVIGEQLEGEETGETEAVDDLAAEDHAKAFGQGNPDTFGDLAGVGAERGDAFVAAAEEEVAGVVEGVQAGMEEQQGLEVVAAQAGFLEHFASGGFGGALAVVDATAGDFPGEGVDEEPVLAHEEDAVGVDEDEAGAGADLGDEVLFGEAFEGS